MQDALYSGRTRRFALANSTFIQAQDIYDARLCRLLCGKALPFRKRPRRFWRLRLRLVDCSSRNANFSLCFPFTIHDLRCSSDAFEFHHHPKQDRSRGRRKRPGLHLQEQPHQRQHKRCSRCPKRSKCFLMEVGHSEGKSADSFSARCSLSHSRFTIYGFA
jgi:hypothetical protein